MATKAIKWSDIKEIVNKLPDHILNQSVTIWNSSEDSGSLAIAIKLLHEDYHYDGAEGCAPLSVIKDNDEEFDENKEDYHLVHAIGTPILIIPDEILF